MEARSPARYLAPIALVATLAGGYVIVHDSATNGHSRPAAQHRRPAHHAPRRRGPFARSAFYVVKSGDTLSGIAAKVGVSLGTLQHLNRGLDPQSIQTGQQIRLRR